MGDSSKIPPPTSDWRERFKGGGEPNAPFIPTLPTPPADRTPNNSDKKGGK
jgi:hypothetical protein